MDEDEEQDISFSKQDNVGSEVVQLDLSPEKSSKQNTKETNGTVTKTTESKDAEMIDEPAAESWVKLFTKNRAAENGIILHYIAPNLVNGQQVVDLVQDEV